MVSLQDEKSFHNQFMNLDNPIKIVVLYILIGEMTCLGCEYGVPMVSALVCRVTNLIWLMVSHNVRLLIIMIHQATILHGK